MSCANSTRGDGSAVCLRGRDAHTGTAGDTGETGSHGDNGKRRKGPPQSPLPLLRSGFFRPAGAPQDRPELVVPFMTRVLEQGTVDAGHLVFAAPRPRPRRWVIHGELIPNRRRAGHRQPLDRLEVLRRSAPPRLLAVV